MPESVLVRKLEAPGWFNHGDRILALIEQHKPVVCVELGSWLGASAIPVARSIRRWGGTLTCVDTWSGDVHGEPSAQAPWMLTSCARNMLQAGVNANVRLITASTMAAVAFWAQPIDYLYVDADHSYDAVRADLEAWVPHVRPGGVLAGDDYGHRHFPGVQQAWDEFTEARGIALTRYQSDPPDADGIQLVFATV